LYAEGACAWQARQFTVPAAAWDALLPLPPAQRHYRSVWAAYRLGRCSAEDKASLAKATFEQAHRLAAEGFAGSQHVAEARVGWEAQALACRRSYAAALFLYVQQFQRGDPTAERPCN